MLELWKALESVIYLEGKSKGYFRKGSALFLMEEKGDGICRHFLL